MSRPLLVLRPEPGASATAGRARALGLSPIVAPLFEIVPVAWHPPDPARFEAVAMTSANAARHAGAALAHYAHLPLFAVGEATAEAARKAGFTCVTAGDADAAALQPLLPARTLHIAGEDHRRLGGDTVIVYRSVLRELPDLPSNAVALLHSPRAAAAFDRPVHAIVAISAATRDAVRTDAAIVAVAECPTDDAMLAIAARLCE